MNNERKNIQKKGVKPTVSRQSSVVSGQSKKPFFILHSSFFILVGILLITFICYHYTLNNQFVNWDDFVYVYDNPVVKNLSPQNFSLIFKDDLGTGNYHPLTMLSLALNWYYAGANPASYYVIEIILHLVNTILVFFLVTALFNAMVKKGYGKINGIPYLAGICALWHGIHPMHVESVSWISERKDVLYFFFYLLGLIVYVRYVTENKKVQMVLVSLLFFLSLLSKPMAIVFPFSLFAFDVLLKRKMERKLFVEKIPLFLISAIFAYITYSIQNKAGAASFHSSAISQQFMIAGYGYLMYILKYFLPVHLSSIYPYPELTEAHSFPLYFYLAPLAAIVITGGILYLTYKKGENYFRVALFGFGFYFFNVMLVLQFISVGSAIMAERYSYASYFGLTFMLVYFLYILTGKMPSFKTPVIISVTAFSCMLAWLCEARTHVWHSSKNLWTDVISKYPVKIDSVYNATDAKYVVRVHSFAEMEIAYKTLGEYYVNKIPPNYDSAFLNYDMLEKIGSKTPSVYSTLGNIWAIRGDFKKSLTEYTRALKIDSTGNNSYGIYLDRGVTYYKMGQFDLALNDFNRADKIKPNSAEIYESRGSLYLNDIKQMDSAIADYTRLIAIDPGKADYYQNRGLAEFNKNDFKDAITDFTKNINLDRKNVNSVFNLSLSYKDIKDYKLALIYANKAKTMGYKLTDGYLEELQTLAKKL